MLHPKTIRPVIDAGIGLRICNTFNPDHPGTRLVADREASSQWGCQSRHRHPRAAADHHRRTGHAGRAGRGGAHLRRGGLHRHQRPADHPGLFRTIDLFCRPVRRHRTGHRALENAFSNELAQQDIDRIWATEEVVIITVVGAGMIHTPGIAGRVFTALGSQNVNVIAIAQGSSEVSISLVVSASDADVAVHALHDLILARSSA